MATVDLKHLPVGQELPPLSKVVTRVQIARYAGASGDFNPIHVDDEFARMVGLGGVIAHGLLTMGIASQAVSEWAGSPLAVKKLKVRFSGMVRPGDTVTIHGRINSTNGDEFTLDVWADTQTGEQVLTKGVAVVVL